MFFLALSWGLALGGCTIPATAPLFSSDSADCLNLNFAVDVPHQPEYFFVEAGQRRFTAGGYRQSDQRACGVKGSLIVEWEGADHSTIRQILEYRGAAPSRFFEDNDNLMVVHVSAEGRAYLGYRTSLSTITRHKELFHPETEEEERQRKLDEALWVAVQNSDAVSLKAALDSGASPFQPWMAGRGELQSPLILLGRALDLGNVRCICELLSHGMRIHESPYLSVLTRAIRINNPDLARLLLERGANPDFRASATDLGLHYRSERVIYFAVLLGRPEIVDLLLQHGASTDFTLSDGVPFLVWARSRLDPDAYASLTAHHAGPPPVAQCS